MHIPRRIHFVVPAEMNAQMKKCVQRARELHPGWELRIWRDDEMPVRSPLAAYLPRCRSGAQRADLIRLAVVEHFGGVYLDSDVLLHGPLDFLPEYDELVVCSEDGMSLTNAFFAAPPGDRLLKKVIGHLLANEPDWSLPPYQTTGPELFARVLRESTGYSVLPREAFYPYPYFAPPGARRAHTHSIGEHLWAGSWLRGGIRKWVRGVYCGGRWVHYQVAPLLRVMDYAARALFRYVASLMLPSGVPLNESVVGITCLGDRIVCLADDVVEKPIICSRGWRELPMEMFLIRVLRGGDLVIDVGGNVGFVSCLAARLVGPFGRVHVFEPNPRTYEALQGTLVANWYQYRVVARNKAVGERKAKMELYVRTERPSGASFESERALSIGFDQAHGAEEGGDSIARQQLVKVDVEAVTLDEIARPGEFFKVLKIDVEGAEAMVLRGARKILSEGRVDYIIVECLPETEYWPEVAQALEEIIAFGYAVGALTRFGKVQWCKSVGEALVRRVGANLVLARRELVGRTWGA